MCVATCYWANIEYIFYGAQVEYALKYGEFKDVDIFTEVCKEPADRIIKSTQVMQEEAVEVSKKFAKMPHRARY